MMTKSTINIVIIVFGAIMQGLAMSLFLFPHNIPSGGAAGLAIIMNHFLALPLGISLWIVNFSFLVLAVKYFGYTWTIKTMLAVTITSVTVSLVTSFISFPKSFILVDLVSGGIMFGIGVGLLIRNGASSGGMVIPALMISNYYEQPPGRVILWLNFFIFLLTALVINFKIVIFAILCQTISTNLVDFIYFVKMPSLTTPSFSWRKK